ncbi:MAG: GGDEF domain-containing protein [Deferribacteraceae bacterium]|jgi:diguanylate cyclase (GGDEF)-like protein|nr:GGDEF domain-containing protein [Deferribacteraceae bacterium]
MFDNHHYQLVEKILDGECISPVYQPVVSLTDGQIYGYEALSRISDKELSMDIEYMFRVADKINRLWELETLCRKKSLENAKTIGADKKLFINVHSNIIHDNKFKEGFTKQRLDEYAINPDNVIFEITERTAILDIDAFMGSINHYKKQNYKIALDDVGAGYSGLNILTNIKPNIIKLDMGLIRNIDKDNTKQLLCKAMIDFCKNAGIKLIAEGIETDEELKVLIKLNADFGQGYFLGIPQETFKNILPNKVEMIKLFRSKNYVENITNSVYPVIGHLAKSGLTFSPDEKATDIYEMLRLNPTVREFSVVENNIAKGFMTRSDLNEILGGRYGFSLHSGKTIEKLMKPDFLRVNYRMPLDQVSKLAMQRSFEQLYNPILVEKDNRYLGVVTIKDLLDACTKIEIDIAMHSNPLTGLPGNLLIEKQILKRLFGKEPYCITYYDIDNFKAYNDAYGFNNGDLMLELVAGILKEHAVKNEFVGHIGGDDFIVICDYHEGEKYCIPVIEKFDSKIASLYREEDINNGFIISKNRHGVTENFPIASLSVAGISNKTTAYNSIDDFSKDIAQLKKKAKKQKGNYFEII